MSLLLENTLLALAWGALTGDTTPRGFAVGFLFGFLALYLFHRNRRRTSYFRKLFMALRFVGFYLFELLLANCRVAYDVATRGYNMHPALLALPLDAKTDFEIALLANLITLTPGTLSVDVSTDRRVLYIHAMYLDDPEEFKRSLKEGLEKRVLELLR